MDEAVALMLVDTNSRKILVAARKTLAFAMVVKNRDKLDPMWPKIEDVSKDLGRLYDAALTMEKDPEVIRKNALARIMSTLSPLIVGFQDYISSPGLPMWKLGTEGLVLVTEVIGATQYLEAARLISATEYERDLWELEMRATDIIDERTDVPGEVKENMERICEFFDEFRGPEYPIESKPTTYFVLALIIFVIAYYDLKAKLNNSNNKK
jgi:hypothetical protein